MVDLISDAKDHSFTGGDFSQMETVFGLGTGAGSNCATLIGLIQTIFNTNTDVTGANRLAQLDEFVGRVAGQ